MSAEDVNVMNLMTGLEEGSLGFTATKQVLKYSTAEVNRCHDATVT